MPTTMTMLLSELCEAVRAVLVRPGFSALIVSMLAAGMACVIFMGLFINGVAIRPLPFPDAQELRNVGIREIDNREQIAVDELGDFSGNDLQQIRRHLDGLADVTSYATATLNFSDQESARRIDGGIVSGNFFRVLGVAPILGRDFTDADAGGGAAPVAMLSYRMWKSQYDGDASIIGRSIRINAQATTVIGVMPREFGFPGAEAAWVPDKPGSAGQWLSDGWGICVALRPRHGVGEAALKQALQTWFTDAGHDQPERMRNQYVLIEPVSNSYPRERELFLTTFAAALLVFLIAGANAANLLLVHAIGRHGEFAMRVALGARPARLARHLMLYSLMLNLLAMSIAVPLAAAAAAWKESHMLQSGAPPWQHFSIDANIVALIFAISLLSALVAGWLPALHASRQSLEAGLRDGAHNITGRSFQRVSRALVVAEIALSCMILIGVGALARAAMQVERMPLGIDQEHLLIAQFDLFADTDADHANALHLYDTLADRLRAEPDVVDASVGFIQPGVRQSTRDVLPAGVTPGQGSLPHIMSGEVDDHCLAAYGIALQEGRFFDAHDTPDSPRVAVVDRRFADIFGEGRSVLGRQFRLDPRNDSAPTVTIIGVTATITLNTPQQPRYPSLLLPLRQAPNRYSVVAVRTRGDADAFAQRLSQIMRSVDADIPLYGIENYSRVLHDMAGRERTNALRLGIFALVALIIAGVGLFGVMSFIVGRRTREIGIRRALGASAWSIVRAVFAAASVQVGAGLALGVLLGIAMARALLRYSETVQVREPPIVLFALGVLILAAASAVFIPARRALRVDPIVALRHQ